ncbi:MAG: hypothetical protein KatS3mg129_1181 [Leptospiraceae bacterium]|nr:MAG: hypothetical protein KatS3mg129_1181 [Leptospiraceae bacterium]
MKNRICIIILILVSCTTHQTRIDNPEFAIYQQDRCKYYHYLYYYLTFKTKIPNCYIERYITPEGVRVAIQWEKNQPYSDSLQVWKESAINFLEESGYEIIEKKSFKEYDYIKTKVYLKDNSYIYGIAFQFDSSDNHIIYLIEFFGEEKAYNKYENDIKSIIDNFYKKK